MKSYFIAFCTVFLTQCFSSCKTRDSSAVYEVNQQETAYQQMKRAALEDGQPLVVLVGTELCEGCNTMKKVVFPNLFKRRALGQVKFLKLDPHEDAEMVDARAILATSSDPASVPQTFFYIPKRDGNGNIGLFRQSYFIGVRSESVIEQEANKAKAAAAAAVAAKDTDSEIR